MENWKKILKLKTHSKLLWHIPRVLCVVKQVSRCCFQLFHFQKFFIPLTLSDQKKKKKCTMWKRSKRCKKKKPPPSVTHRHSPSLCVTPPVHLGLPFRSSFSQSIFGRFCWFSIACKICKSTSPHNGTKERVCLSIPSNGCVDNDSTEVFFRVTLHYPNLSGRNTKTK